MSVKIKTLLHEFRMGDVEDPELYAAQPLWEWQKTEAGTWCMEHCAEPPTFYVNVDPHNYGYRITVVGELEEKDHIFWKLKYSK
jgi:hypothetical protein